MLPVVPVQPRRPSDHPAAAGEEVLGRLRVAAEPLRGARLLQVNSTPFGGVEAVRERSLVARGLEDHARLLARLAA